MTEILKEGKWLDPAVQKNSTFNIQKEFERVIYGMLMTKAWSLNKDLEPMIMFVNQ
jgi:hypothetical protein